MDWPRAKSILLVSFLLVDLYLAWLLLAPPGAASRVLSTEDVQDLMTISQHFGVDLVGIPQPLAVGRVADLPLQEQNLSEADARAYADTWLGSGATLEQQTPGFYRFTQGEGWLEVRFSRFYTDLHLQLVSPQPGLSGTEAENRDLAQRWLADRLADGQVARMQAGMLLKDAEQGHYLIEFNSLQGGLPVFTDCYRLLVASGQVTGFTARLSQVGRATGPKSELVTADQPVKRLLAQTGVLTDHRAAILDLRLGLGLIPGYEQTLQPVWRLITTLAGQEELIYPAAESYWGDEAR